MDNRPGVRVLADSLPRWALESRRVVDPTPNARDIEEVRRMGGRRSCGRSGDQTAAAIFWSGHPWIPWCRVARILAARVGMDAGALASAIEWRVPDALAIGQQLRSRDHFPRPREWIRGNVHPVNGKRRLDPHWEPLLASRQRYEYPCDGCIVAGMVVALLRSILGTDAAAVVVTAPSDEGITREFETLSHMLQESEDARVWGGLHFRATAVASTELGLRFSGHNSPWPPSPPPPRRTAG